MPLSIAGNSDIEVIEESLQAEITAEHQADRKGNHERSVDLSTRHGHVLPFSRSATSLLSQLKASFIDLSPTLVVKSSPEELRSSICHAGRNIHNTSCRVTNVEEVPFRNPEGRGVLVGRASSAATT